MAVGLAIGIGLVVGVVLSIYMLSQIPQHDMDKASLEDFSNTQCAEGSVVPVIFGTVKTAGNLLWYGNLDTVEVIEEGKSIVGIQISDDITTGYEYYLDIWQAICMGEVEIQSVFIQDEPFTLSKFYNRCTDGYLFNDGTGPENPQSRIGAATVPYATALRGHPTGVAHFFMERYFVGENITAMPTIHWVVKKTSTAPIIRMTGYSNPNIANLSNGTNPAAVIYDLLVMGGAVASEIDENSFSWAGTYWEVKGYGLNLILDRLQEVRDHIQTVFSYVDGCLSQDDQTGKYVLTAYKDDGSETPVATIDTEDFISFKFSRSDWADTFNYFKATLTDADQAYTKRTITVMNPANIGMVGFRRPKSVDLKAYTDIDVASGRLWEIMKRESYPGAAIDFTTNLEFSEIQEGQLITINNTDYGISSAEFRVMEKGLGNIDDNELTFSAIQDVPGLMDDFYAVGGNPSGVDLDLNVLPLAYGKAFEMPFIASGHTPTWLFLGARQGNEVGMRLMVSLDAGVNYYKQKDITTFATQGTIDGAYPVTYDIDDTTGILFTPYREDPEFSALSRAQLFDITRYAIIDDEVMSFQYMTPVATDQFRLEGVMRGLFNTDIVEHSNGSVIWICNVGSNLTQSISASSFYVKLQPFIGSTLVDLGDVSAISCTLESKAATPFPPTRIQVVRSGGTTGTVTWWPTTQDSLGAAWKPGEDEGDQTPAWDGDFYVRDHYNGANDQYVDGTSVVLTIGAGTQYIKVQARVNGVLSDQIQVTVSPADGTYTGPDA